MTTIYCYTSTGNNLYAAKMIADKTGGNVAPMSGEAVECGDDVIGFVFPVFFLGLPRLVERFITNLRISDKNAYTFAMVTYGNVGVGVVSKVASLLREKGIALRYGVSVRSVENYIPSYKINDSEELRTEFGRRIGEIAEAVNRRESKRGSAFTIINRLVYKFYPDAGSDRDFSVVTSCTGCSICMKICPAENIQMVSGKPEFLHKCDHCITCVQNCPSQAINWKGKTEGKQRYRHATVSLDDLISFYGR